MEMANIRLAWGFGMQSMGPMTVGTKDFGTNSLHPAQSHTGHTSWNRFLIVN